MWWGAGLISLSKSTAHSPQKQARLRMTWSVWIIFFPLTDYCRNPSSCLHFCNHVVHVSLGFLFYFGNTVLSRQIPCPVTFPTCVTTCPALKCFTSVLLPNSNSFVRLLKSLSRSFFTVSLSVSAPCVHVPVLPVLLLNIDLFLCSVFPLFLSFFICSLSFMCLYVCVFSSVFAYLRSFLVLFHFLADKLRWCKHDAALF